MGKFVKCTHSNIFFCSAGRTEKQTGCTIQEGEAAVRERCMVFIRYGLLPEFVPVALHHILALKKIIQ